MSEVLVKCKCPHCPGCIPKEGIKNKCSTCGVEKPLAMFDKGRRGCKTCRKK